VTSPITAGGLTIDIAGAVLIASALAFKRPKARLLEAGTTYGWNVHLEAGLARQTADAQVAGLLLVAGFLGQLLGAAGIHGSWWPTFLFAVAFIGSAFVFLDTVLRKKAVADAFWAHAEDDEPGQKMRFEKDAADYVRFYGNVARVPLLPGDTPRSYGDRFVGKKWLKFVDSLQEPFRSRMDEPYA